MAGDPVNGQRASRQAADDGVLVAGLGLKRRDWMRVRSGRREVKPPNAAAHPSWLIRPLVKAALHRLSAVDRHDFAMRAANGRDAVHRASESGNRSLDLFDDPIRVLELPHQVAQREVDVAVEDD
jgi:hypothetical protein